MVFLLQNFFHFRLSMIKIVFFVCVCFPHILAANNKYYEYNLPEKAENVQCLDFTEQIKTLMDKLKDLEASQRTTGQNSHTQKEQNEYEEYPDSSQLVELSQSLESAQHNAEQLNESKESLSSCKQDLLQLNKCRDNITNSHIEMNKLQRLVLERYTPADVVTAARESNMEKLRLLLDAGMSVESQDPSYYGNTPLHVAAHTGQLEMIRFLVERGASLEARNADNNTPFSDTAVGGSIPAAELLIELGANPNARGWHGETAQDTAIRAGQTAFANWIRDHGW